MSDLISRQAAIDSLRFCELGMETETIANIPSIDAVPVVRCRDCKYFWINNKEPIHAVCTKHDQSLFMWDEKVRDGYCSWGEKKDDKTEPPKEETHDNN